MAGSGPEATAFGPVAVVSPSPPEALNPVPAGNSHRLDRRDVTRIQRPSVRGPNAGPDLQGNRQLARIASVDLAKCNPASNASIGASSLRIESCSSEANDQ